MTRKTFSYTLKPPANRALDGKMKETQTANMFLEGRNPFLDLRGKQDAKPKTHFEVPEIQTFTGPVL